MSEYITVLLEVRVPEGESCWPYHEGVGDTPICSHFDNYSADTCKLFGMTLMHNTLGEPEKCADCMAMKEVK